MTLLRNRALNPSGEGDLWLPWTGSTTINRMTSSASVTGASYQRATVTDAATNIGIRTAGNPVNAGSVISVMQAGKTNASGSALRMRLLFRDAANADVGQVFSAWVTSAGGAAWRWPILRDVPVPASAVTVETLIYVVADAGGGPLDPVASQFLDADALMIVEGSNVTLEPALYADGDSLGWAWDGTAHASSSRGPVPGSYAPEARLSVQGLAGFELVGYLDQLAGFELEAEGRSIVHRSAVPDANYPVSVSHRPAGSDTGSMVARFTTETGEGMPGERALKIYNALKRGGHYSLGLELYLPGWSGFTFAQVGGIRAAREPGISDRWTVEFGIDTLAVGDYL